MNSRRKQTISAKFTYTAAVQLARILALLILLIAGICVARNSTAPALRWSPNRQNCTLRRAEDGRTYYGISSADSEIVLGVDTRELEKVPRRATPMLAVLLSFRYKGATEAAIRPRRFTLEFVKHSHVIKPSLEPDEIVRDLQENAEDLTHHVEKHEIGNHPELKEQKETELQERLKNYTDLSDFISTLALRPVTLNSANSSATGWVFFSVKDRWIGPWRRPEQFVLRVPLEGVVLEFPFSLPPEGEGPELRHRD